MPDNFVKAKDAYTKRVVDAFHSFKPDDAIAFAKTTAIKGYVLVTQVRLLRTSCACGCPSFRVRSPGSPHHCCPPGSSDRVRPEHGASTEGGEQRLEDHERPVDIVQVLGLECALPLYRNRRSPLAAPHHPPLRNDRTPCHIVRDEPASCPAVIERHAYL